jgi:hypothetical protein
MIFLDVASGIFYKLANSDLHKSTYPNKFWVPKFVLCTKYRSSICAYLKYKMDHTG